MTKKEIKKIVAECIKQDLTDAVVSEIEKKIDSRVQRLVAQCFENKEQKESDERGSLHNYLKKVVEKEGGRLLTHEERFPWLYRKTCKKRN
jgi:hypothetical protein